MYTNNFELNDEQKEVQKEIKSLELGDRLVVSGRAGSGKTHAITRSVDGFKALFLAPTHPAKAILEKELFGTEHRVMTIQKAIGWKKRYNEEGLRSIQTYRSATEVKEGVMGKSCCASSVFAEANIVIVDEFSMVGRFLFEAIEDYANEFGLPVVYSGDPFQLPPVNDEEVIAKKGFKTITLEESMRFSKDSKIFSIGERLRDSIENEPDEPFDCIVGGDDVEVVTGSVWKARAIADYKAATNMLAVTSDNSRQSKLRAVVRERAGEQLCEGDLVVSKQTDDLFQNGQAMRVSAAEPTAKTLPDVARCLSADGNLSVHGYRLSFVDRTDEAFVLKNEGERSALIGRIKRLYEKGKLNYQQATYALEWIEQINQFELEAFATVHKSQGRSVDTIYIDTSSVVKKPDWLSMEHFKRLLYTSFTRAKKRVLLYRMEGLCEFAT